jgi:CubicO group peptidase (beta-lactamase class C family)
MQMIIYDAGIQDLIKKMCMGKKHIKLTIGTYMEGKNAIHVFDATGEISNENYVYPIGSVTKTFVASLLSKYVHEGKMSLDDSISKYIGGLDNGRYYPTLKRLAAHTSGYATRLGANAIMAVFVDEVKEGFGIGGGYNPYNLTLEEMTRIVRKKLVADKDYRWNYSNFNYALLGYAIGVASGQGYWKTMDDFLLNDIEMSSSYTGIKSQNISAYNWNNKNVCHWFEKKDYAAPCGDISATA